MTARHTAALITVATLYALAALGVVLLLVVGSQS